MANSTTVPYLTEQEIRNKYAQQEKDYTTQRQAEADRATNSANTQYDNTLRQHYINYMQNQKDLPEQLARQGISGGASETSLLRGQTNYENNVGNTNRDRNARLAEITNNLNDTLNTYRMTANANMNDEIAQNRQLQANYEKQLQQEAETRFANTISGYDSISAIDKMMNDIRKSGVDTWRLDYLRARRAELAAQQAANASGGGGYSYSGGGSGGGNGGDGGGNVITNPTGNLAARAKTGNYTVRTPINNYRNRVLSYLNNR